MHIGIFVAMAGRQAGGPETYEHCLVRELATVDRENEYQVFCLSHAAADSFHIDQENFTFHVLRPGIRWLSIPLSLPIAIRRSGVDFYHATFIPPPFSPRPYIFTLHGSDAFMRPELFRRSALWRVKPLLQRGLRKAKLVLCVSEHVKGVVAERYRIPADRLAVIYNGVGGNFRPLPSDEARRLVRERYGISSPYVLYVGKLIAGKNIGRLLEAFRRFRHETKADVQLVLAGRTFETLTGIEGADLGSKPGGSVVRTGYVDHGDLPALYSEALMFTFPSLWEGFGLPVIEAMACGAPVITSNVSSLPEIAGDAAVLVDPTSVEEIADAIVRVYSSTELRQALRDKGLERARSFTWKQAALETLEAYRKVSGS